MIVMLCRPLLIAWVPDLTSVGICGRKYHSGTVTVGDSFSTFVCLVVVAIGTVVSHLHSCVVFCVTFMGASRTFILYIQVHAVAVRLLEAVW